MRRSIRSIQGRQRDNWRLRVERRRAAVARRSVGQLGLVVRGGPFAGLCYVPRSERVLDLPSKLIGAYERELHPWIEELVDADFEQVVNVGSGDGYYAVGLARRMPETEVIAFDSDGDRRELSEAVARANGVAGRLSVRGSCGPKELEALDIGPGTLLLVDCEGCEADLLRPDLLSGLAGCTILVELHEFVERGISARILARFSETHSATRVSSTPRRAREHPSLSFLGPLDRRIALSEYRPEQMEWVLLRPLAEQLTDRSAAALFLRP